MVNRDEVVHADDLLGRDVTEHGDLLLRRRLDRFSDQQTARDL